MHARAATAFAPATITNFFAVHYDKHSAKDLLHSGATGGGYMLSKGVVTRATVLGGGRSSLEVVVNGDADYDARTTRAAVNLMLKRSGVKPARLRLEQKVDVPIGQGFGASAASALSAVFATAGALRLELSKERIAYFAHVAEITEKTGLGTVSVAYDGVGVGAVYEPGAPGVAKFMNVRVPPRMGVVAASLTPFHDGELLSSNKTIATVNRLGGEALALVMADPTLECLAEAGERFAKKLGIMRPEVKALVKRAKSAGALYASQNMLGHAMHAIVHEGEVEEVASALAASSSKPRVDVLEFDSQKAGVTSVAELRYPTVTRSFV